MAALAPLAATWRRRLALGWLLLLLALAVLAPVLPLPFLPGQPDLAQVAAPPLAAGRHWLGTDAQGRDVLSGLVFGARTALLLTLPAAGLAALLGAVAGGAAGFWGNRLRLPWWAVGLAAALAGGALGLPRAADGAALLAGVLVAARPGGRRGCPLPLDALVLGLATLLDTVPRLLLLVAVAASTGTTVAGLLLLLALVAWPPMARLVRARMLSVREQPFVEAARAAGLPAAQVWWRHALPAAVRPLRAALPLSFASLLGLESSLSFLGIGLPPDVASWGQQLAAVRQAPGVWWAFAFPAAMLFASMLSAIQLGRPGLTTPQTR